ncbi:hypothetical protein ACPZ19_49255 [Amycolatopsis lurida]
MGDWKWQTVSNQRGMNGMKARTRGGKPAYLPTAEQP